MKRKITLVTLLIFLFCTMTLAAPPWPNDAQIVQPDPSLPKELAAFSGKWEGRGGRIDFAVIVEKINENEATLYLWRSDWGNEWERKVANVVKERGKYKIWFSGRTGINELSLSGKYLDLSVTPLGSIRFTRVP